mgnify:CR=1 FL=1
MNIVVDVVIVAIIALSTLLAYRKGLISLAIGLVSFIVALVLTLILYRPIASIIINYTSIDDMIANSIYADSSDSINQNAENAEYLIDQAKNNLLPEAAHNLANNIVTGIVALVLFVAIQIILRLIKALANLIAKLPILSQINKAGGVVYGLLRGVLIIYVVMLLISISAEIDPENAAFTAIEDSYVGNFMYENNLLKNMFF